MASKQFNTRDGANIGHAFHEQVKQAQARHPGYDDTIFAMCFAPLMNGMKSEEAQTFMKLALMAECEAIRGEAKKVAA